MLLAWGPLYRTDINHHSHFAFRRRDILSSVSSQASLSLKEQTAPKSELAGASSRLWDVKNIPSPSASSMWLSKLFLKRPSSEKTTLQHCWYLNCLFIQFVKGFEWVFWGRSMEASWKQSHTAREDEPPTHTYKPGFLIYFKLHLEKRHRVKFAANKGELARLSLREVTDNWQPPLDPEAASLERWWRLEVGRRGRSRSSSWETELHLEFLGNWKIPLDPKSWRPPNTQWEGDGEEGEFHLFKFRVALQTFTPSFPPLCQELPHAAFVPRSIQKSMKTLVVWRKDALGVGGEFLKNRGKSHLFLYLHHSAHK